MPHDPRMFASDLDGTLLNALHEADWDYPPRHSRAD